MFTGNRWRSLKTKVIVAFLICLVIPPLVVSLYINTTVRQNLLEDYGQTALRDLEIQSHEITFLLDESIADINFLSQIPVVREFITTPTADNRMEVETIFAAFALNNPLYDQVRLLSSDGIEILRVNHYDGEVEIVSDSGLQDKSSHSYFLEAIALAAGEVYVSPLNLNQEEGVIEEPYTPVLRYAMPLYSDDDELLAILVLNLLAQDLLTQISFLDHGANHYLINGSGDIMYTTRPDSDDLLYAGDLGHENTLDLLFPLIPSGAIEADYIRDFQNKRMIAYAPITTNSDTVQRNWILVTTHDSGDITAAVNRTILSLTASGLFGLTISLIVGLPITLAIIRPIQVLHRASRDLRKRNWQSSIELAESARSKDEIGDLAHSLVEALHELRNMYTQMEIMVKDRTIELEWANKQLKQVDAIKTKFMEDIAHDIRTPLTSIVMNTSMIEINPDATDRYIKRIETHVERIKSLLENVTTMSKVELNFEEIVEFEPVLLHELISPIIEAHFTIIEDLGLELKTDIANVPAIQGHAFMLEQVFENLFTNAIKYTKTGSVTVSLKYADKKILLKVIDTGIGIAEEEIPLVLRRYYRAENVRQSNISGTGIGLSIVANTVQLHGGDINIKSSPGTGTEITVTLPINKNAKDH